MPPFPEPKQKGVAELSDDFGTFAPAAFDFIQEGIRFTVDLIHGEAKASDLTVNRHVSGQQLCEGLREMALQKWGMMSRVVLGSWNVRNTADFGRIVFTLISAGHMQKTDEDSLEDFKNVYDFKQAFETAYQIPAAV